MPMWRSAVAAGLVPLVVGLLIAAPARAASGTWERAWGKDVVVGGGTGFEVCLVAAGVEALGDDLVPVPESCKQGSNLGGLGGELSNPYGVAADPAGNVYVVDRTNNRIQKFDSSGNFLRTWGKDVVAGGGTGFEICTVAASCKQGATGGLGGELNDPLGVAVDAAGNVYVADASNGRIQKFDSSGNFMRAWGTDVDTGGDMGFEVCTVAASCKAAIAGEGLGGELSAPIGVATDAAGHVYVADTFNNRIQKFDSSGNWLRAWGKDVVTGGGTGFEICTAAASCKQGATGRLGGEFNPPIAVAVDAAANVYVADASFQPDTSDPSNQRIQKFDSSGNWERAWGKDVVSGGGTGFEICTVAASCQAGLTGGLGGELNHATGVALDSAGNVYVADRFNQRIQKFDSSGNWERAWGNNVDTDLDSIVSGSVDICTVAASCQAGVPAGGGGALFNPFGVAADAAGNLYVADTDNFRIQRFAEPQTLTVTVGGSGFGLVTGPGIRCPSDVCTAGYGLGASVTLHATPDSYSGFAGWGGACSGTGSSCQLTLDADKGVSATFNIPCGGTAPTIIGTNGNDVLSGTSGRDVIEGLGGNDKLSGFAGSDLLCGGGGGDTLSGGKGKDKLYGEKGKDVLRGGGGKDKLKGGKGKDKLVQ